MFNMTSKRETTTLVHTARVESSSEQQSQTSSANIVTNEQALIMQDLLRLARECEALSERAAMHFQNKYHTSANAANTAARVLRDAMGHCFK